MAGTAIHDLLTFHAAKPAETARKSPGWFPQTPTPRPPTPGQKTAGVHPANSPANHPPRPHPPRTPYPHHQTPLRKHPASQSPHAAPQRHRRQSTNPQVSAPQRDHRHTKTPDWRSPVSARLKPARKAHPVALCRRQTASRLASAPQILSPCKTPSRIRPSPKRKPPQSSALGPTPIKWQLSDPTESGDRAVD